MDLLIVKINKKNITEVLIMARSGGPGSFVFGDEERKEVMEVLEGRYLFRYGAADSVLPTYCFPEACRHIALPHRKL